MNIYLFHGDSGQQVFSHLDYPNPTNRAGDITALVNDTWWGDRGTDYKGQNISYLFYWVITPGGQSLGTNYLPQATFTAVRKFLSVIHLPSAHPYFPPPARFPRLTENPSHRDDLPRFDAFHHVFKFIILRNRPPKLQPISYIQAYRKCPKQQ